MVNDVSTTRTRQIEEMGNEDYDEGKVDEVNGEDLDRNAEEKFMGLTDSLEEEAQQQELQQVVQMDWKVSNDDEQEEEDAPAEKEEELPASEGAKREEPEEEEEAPSPEEEGANEPLENTGKVKKVREDFIRKQESRLLQIASKIKQLESQISLRTNQVLREVPEHNWVLIMNFCKNKIQVTTFSW